MSRTAWFLSLIGALNAFGALPCPQTLRSWGLFSSAREFDTPLYWMFRNEVKLRAPSLEELTTPEKLFAYRDALTDSKEPFIDQIRSLEDLGGRLWLAHFKQSSDFQFATAFPFVKRSRRNPLIRSRSQGRAVLFSVNAPPKDQDSLTALLAYYSLCLASYRIRTATSYSKPFDPGFVERSLHHLERAESHLYETLSLLNAPERLVRRLVPDFERYQAYLKGDLKSALERDFRRPLSRKWFYDRAQDFLKGTGALGLGTLVFFASESLTEGKFESRLSRAHEKMESLFSAYSKQRVEAGTEEYVEILNTPSPLEDPYESEIQRLRQEIAAGRDPQGELQSQVEELKRRKDLLKE